MGRVLRAAWGWLAASDGLDWFLGCLVWWLVMWAGLISVIWSG